MRSGDTGMPWVWAFRPVQCARTMIIKYTNLVNNTGIPTYPSSDLAMQNVQALRGTECAERAEVREVQVLGIPIPATPPGSVA